MRISRAALFAGLALLATLEQAQGNWPQWRGPKSNGSAPQARNLPVSWNETENLAWKTKLPSWSAATPIIFEDTIYVTSAEEGSPSINPERRGRPGAPAAEAGHDRLFLIAVNRKDGSIRWQQQIDSGNQLYRKQNSASPSPIADGKHVWIMTGNGKLSCFTSAGKEVWKRDIQADYGKFGINHGYASTPLLHGDRLFVQVIHGFTTDAPSYVFAVDKTTGKTVWKVERPTDAVNESKDSYSTPQIANVKGIDELIVSGADRVTGHDPRTGKEIWRIRGFNPTSNPTNRTIASSVVIGGQVYTPSTRGRPFIAFRAGGSGDLTGKSEMWTNNLGADVPTPATDGKYVYVLNDKGILNCLEAMTGTVVYEGQRIELGTYSASPLLADGKLYNTNEEGVTTVVQAGPEFKVLGAGKLEGLALASPAAADNQIFLRMGDYLYCIQKK